VATLHPRALRYVFTFREFADLVSEIDPSALASDERGEAADHVRRVVQLAASQRGVRQPLSDGEADIVDPYRQDSAVFERMTSQIMASLPAISRALGAP
jgi:protein-tyrosine phosphatase